MGHCKHTARTREREQLSSRKVFIHFQTWAGTHRHMYTVTVFFPWKNISLWSRRTNMAQSQIFILSSCLAADMRVMEKCSAKPKPPQTNCWIQPQSLTSQGCQLLPTPDRNTSREKCKALYLRKHNPLHQYMLESGLAENGLGIPKGPS